MLEVGGYAPLPRAGSRRSEPEEMRRGRRTKQNNLGVHVLPSRFWKPEAIVVMLVCCRCKVFKARDHPSRLQDVHHSKVRYLLVHGLFVISLHGYGRDNHDSLIPPNLTPSLTTDQEMEKQCHPARCSPSCLQENSPFLSRIVEAQS